MVSTGKAFPVNRHLSSQQDCNNTDSRHSSLLFSALQQCWEKEFTWAFPTQLLSNIVINQHIASFIIRLIKKYVVEFTISKNNLSWFSNFFKALHGLHFKLRLFLKQFFYLRKSRKRHTYHKDFFITVYKSFFSKTALWLPLLTRKGALWLSSVAF